MASLVAHTNSLIPEKYLLSKTIKREGSLNRKDVIKVFFCFLENLQVKGLSIEHEKLAVAQRHVVDNNNSSTDSGGGNIAEVPETPETGLGRGVKRTPTPAPSPALNSYSLPNAYSTAHYYESPQKRLIRYKPQYQILSSIHPFFFSQQIINIFLKNQN